MLEQTVTEMQSDLIKMRQASAQVHPPIESLCTVSPLSSQCPTQLQTAP